MFTVFTKVQNKILENEKIIFKKDGISFSRKNYITKQSERVANLFLELILVEIRKRQQDIMDEFYKSLSSHLKLKIEEILVDYGLVTKEEALAIDGSGIVVLLAGISVGVTAQVLTSFLVTRAVTAGVVVAGEAAAAALGIAWIPVVGWIAAETIAFGGLVWTFSDYIGAWSKTNANESIMKILFDNFHKNKAAFLTQTVEDFEKGLNNFLDLLKRSKEKSEITENLISIANTYQPQRVLIPDPDFTRITNTFLEGADAMLIDFFKESNR